MGALALFALVWIGLLRSSLATIAYGAHMQESRIRFSANGNDVGGNRRTTKCDVAITTASPTPQTTIAGDTRRRAPFHCVFVNRETPVLRRRKRARALAVRGNFRFADQIRPRGRVKAAQQGFRNEERQLGIAYPTDAVGSVRPCLGIFD